MENYYLIALASLSFIFLLREIYHIKIKKHASLLKEENENFKFEKQESSKKIEYLQIHLATEKQKNQFFENFQSKNLELTKGILYDLTKDLSKQILDTHREEQLHSRKVTQETINSNSEKFNKEFEKLLQYLSVLSKDVEQSKGTVDIIKQALLSPTGAGSLAEITLENLLKNSGLKNNTDFIMQYHISRPNNSSLRPDAVVFLPGDNVIIIDSKASKFLMDIVTGSEDEKKANIEGFLRTMNQHLKQLTKKDYKEEVINYLNSLSTKVNHVVTLMFLPSEQAIDKIHSYDKDFIERAWQQNIFPVGPSGLLNMLSFAKFQISENSRYENYQHILEEVKKVVLSINRLAEHSKKMGSSLHALVVSYDKFAGSFNKNFLNSAKNINNLGFEVNNKETTKNLERFQIVSSTATNNEEEQLEIVSEVTEASPHP